LSFHFESITDADRMRGATTCVHDEGDGAHAPYDGVEATV